MDKQQNCLDYHHAQKHLRSIVLPYSTAFYMAQSVRKNMMNIVNLFDDLSRDEADSQVLIELQARMSRD